jgi:hypothetical protein
VSTPFVEEKKEFKREETRRNQLNLENIIRIEKQRRWVIAPVIFYLIMAGSFCLKKKLQV